MKIYCVCSHCGFVSTDEATIEINFRDNIIYTVCEKCKKENKMIMQIGAAPLPKIRTRQGR